MMNCGGYVWNTDLTFQNSIFPSKSYSTTRGRPHTHAYRGTGNRRKNGKVEDWRGGEKERMIQAPRTKRPEWVDIQQRFESWGDSFTRRAVTTWCWLNPDHINMTDQEIVIGMMTDLWNSMNRSERNEFCGKLIDEAGILEFAKKRSAG